MEELKVVRIVGVQIPMGDLIVLILKVAIAAIPALVLLTFIGGIVMAVLSAAFLGGSHAH